MVRAGSPAALLRLVPRLLGFVSEASLVVIGVTLRYDLPYPPEPDLVADIAAHAVGVLSAQRLTAAVAIGYGPEALVTPVANELRDAAWQAGIDLLEFLRVTGGRYWSYACGNEACCPAEGVPFEAASADPAEAEALAAVGDRVWPAGPPWPPASPSRRHRRRIDAPGHPPGRAARDPAAGQGPPVGPPRRGPGT